ncbi:uncharacterized protein LOC103312978 [Tribolium castaneum]|uniref:CHK kinase-like domain-containing protein n=1 Tax=Tribolium castaneum TaxID=7070 RepID=D6WK28_TRICA|nr:PREDICTED: uncharacterized protein LOC103312978 [Tribolium castaneum]EFA03939.1 hypothetical protein TcasGA2_TC014080 [Tribolium castaneum]|eukprot:XP_008193194.1 PREDICTED: uncharacterized protein LOC103312978 [Tribolium castaneum]
MTELKFSLKDCDEVVRRRLSPDATTADFEAIPRHRDNFILKITTTRGDTWCFYAKSGTQPPKIDPILDDFRAKIPNFDASFTPKHYCSKPGLQIFEDLTCQRFQCELDRFTASHFRQVLSVLAEFHAAGVAYEEITARKLGQEYELESFNFDVREIEDVLANKEVVSHVVKNLEEGLGKFRPVLCHGDLIWSNALFHYDNGVPDNCKLINFKARLYAPPAYDVLQLIFFNSGEKFRMEHFESLLIYYHTRLKEALEKYHLDICKILPLEDLQQSTHALLLLIKLELVLRNKEQKKGRDEVKEILSCPQISREDCFTIVRNKIHSNDYDLLSFKLIDNVKLKIQIRRDLTEETLHFRTKSAENCAREIFFYSTLIPILQELEIEIINNCAPASYFQRRNSFIVFEHLFNYHPLPKSSLSDLKLLSIIVKKLAKLHASSLVFEEKMSRDLKRTYRASDDYSEHFEETNFETASGSIPCDENLKKCFPKIAEICASNQFRKIISHGNLNYDNVFVHDKIDCRFVNYESLKYVPPAYDFLSVVYLAEKKLEGELRRIYYDELKQIVASFNFDLSKIITWDEFVDSVESVRPVILAKKILEGSRDLLLELEESCHFLLSRN